MSDKWMVLGASPSAPDYYQIPDVGVIASSGAAILLCRPDWYFLNEIEKLWLYPDELKDARSKGTKVVLHQRLLRPIREEKGEDFEYPVDEWINDFSHGSIWRSHEYWTPGRYSAAVGGCLALQWAVNHGAKEIHIVGLEGYSGGVDYFTGANGNDIGPRLTHESYGPLMQKIIETSPDIQFIMYGNPLYQLQAENLTFYGRPNSAPALSRELSLKGSV